MVSVAGTPRALEDFPAVANPSEDELRLIALIRSTPYGEVLVVRQDGRTVRASRSQSFK